MERDSESEDSSEVSCAILLARFHAIERILVCFVMGCHLIVLLGIILCNSQSEDDVKSKKTKKKQKDGMYVIAQISVEKMHRYGILDAKMCLIVVQNCARQQGLKSPARIDDSNYTGFKISLPNVDGDIIKDSSTKQKTVCNVSNPSGGPMCLSGRECHEPYAPTSSRTSRCLSTLNGTRLRLLLRQPQVRPRRPGPPRPLLSNRYIPRSHAYV